MSIVGLMVAVVLMLALLVWVLLPLVRRGAHVRGAAFTDKQRERALAYYERVLTNVRDLDEDHRTGKIDEAEYRRERAYWMDRGVKLLQLLDELDEQHPITADQDADDAAIDTAIEAAIAAMRDTPPSSEPSTASQRV
jgi:hypothetical protein